VPITVDGRIWGMLTATTPDRSLPAGTEDRLAQFSELVAAAIANAAHRAQLTASRARMMATADDVRRRLQRDVHDGAQQRLVQTVITLKLARAALDDGGHAAAAALVDESLAHAQRATSELRDIVHGILPASLSRGGLRGGVESLIASHPLPVSASIDVPRLAPATETTAYFVIAEALTNVVKHAGATRAEVSAGVNGRWLTVMVRDDGAGGAVPARGSGLTGLYDRVEAGEGTLTVTSPPGRGTTVRAVLPVEAPVPTASADGQAELPLG
jgi:signal transduction histidine kinase